MVPEGVENIEVWAFTGCSNLESISFPESLKRFNTEAFSGCAALTSIVYSGSKGAWAAVEMEGSELFLENVEITYLKSDSGSCGEHVNWAYEDGVLTIRGTGAMEDFEDFAAPWASLHDKITSVVIEDGVTTIGDNAFQFCTALTIITFPESVTVIERSAFESCTSLESTSVPLHELTQ